MTQEQLDSLVEKYLNGRCSPEETRLLQQWYDGFGERQLPVELVDPGARKLLESRMFSRVRSNIAGSNRTWRPLKRSIYHAFSGMAALLFLAAALFFTRQRAALSPGKSPVREVRGVYVKNFSGSLLKKILPDGSEIWLYPGSRIDYPSAFSTRERRIKMDGEAFFLITPDKKKPFIINSGTMETRVWGTSFKIRDHRGMPPQVSVATGRVSVNLKAHMKNGVVLTANQVGAVGPGSDGMIKQAHQRPIHEMAMWRKISLSFSDTAVDEVVKRLNREFGADIVINDNIIAGYTLTADFADENLANILDILRKSLNINYVIEGEEIKLITN